MNGARIDKKKMWIELSRVVVYFLFCTNVAIAYYARQNANGPGKYAATKVTVNDNDNLHQSRYTKFDRVRSRIENMNAETSWTTYNNLRIRHKGWSGSYRTITTTAPTTTTTSDEGLFDTYGDLEEDVDDDEEDTTKDDDDDDEDDIDDDDDSNYDDDSFFETEQAEEPTERSVISIQPASSLTEYKWRHYGSMASVTESRRKQLNINDKQKAITAVLKHFARVNQQARCRKPYPKVVQVQKEHPNSSITYTPECTILHRCSEDTGCCKYNTKCQWKSRDLVELYFYAKALNARESVVEKLTFYNHTECECRENSTHNELNEPSEPVADSAAKLSFRSADSYYGPPKKLRRVKCPRHFHSDPIYEEDRCYCDCLAANLDCSQLKKGKEHLGIADRICIANNDCCTPRCEYGPYATNEGKCPSKRETIDGFRRLTIY